jgi:hypothetical protein
MVEARPVTVAAVPIMARPMTVTVPPLPPPDAMPARATALGAANMARPTIVAPPPTTSSGRQTLALVAVMVLMLAGIGAGVWFWLNPFSPVSPEPDPVAAGKKETTKETKNPLEELRVYLAPKDMVDAIAIDLSKIPRKEQEQQRYFTLVHLHNNPAVTTTELDNYRKALQDLVKHLTDQPSSLVAVDKDRLIFRVDLKTANWEDKNWRVAAMYYPYGLNLENVLYLSEPYNYIMKATRAPITWVYADWFIASASDPEGKLYDTLHVSDKADPLPDSVKKLAKNYLEQPVTLELATTELGLEPKESARVKNLVADKTNLGLEELAKGKTIAREDWTSQKKASLASVYQAVALELGMGTPIQIK